jgi:hypothetical protein
MLHKKGKSVVPPSIAIFVIEGQIAKVKGLVVSIHSWCLCMLFSRNTPM